MMLTAEQAGDLAQSALPACTVEQVDAWEEAIDQAERVLDRRDWPAGVDDLAGAALGAVQDLRDQVMKLRPPATAEARQRMRELFAGKKR